MTNQAADEGRIDPQSASTFAQMVRAAAAAYGDEQAIVLNRSDNSVEALTFRDLESATARTAKGLLAGGIGKGSRVGFIYGNGPGFAVMFGAIARIGAIAVPISTLIKAGELVRVLRQSDVGMLILQRELLGKDYVERICEALPELAKASGPDLRIPAVPFLRQVISSGAGLPPTIGDLEQMISAGDSVSDELLRAVESEVHPTDQIMEIYTSGSMALPKGVKHLHGPMLFRAGYLSMMTKRHRGEKAPVFMPFFWVGGLMMGLMPSWMSGAVTISTEVTITNSQTAMGSVLPEDDLKALALKPPFWGLGMTETLGPYSFGDEIRAPGRPLCSPMDHFADRYEVRIADENDHPVKDGEIGEMQVRGYPLTPGLHKVERDANFTADGYYRTSDMCLVEGSRVHFIGRSGDMIKTAGANVSPAEVEMEMQQLDGVHSAYVVGLPDSERGELVIAAVVPRQGVTLDFDAIQQELRNRLSSFKVPRAYVEISRQDVPMLHSNKVARRQIQELVAERLGRQIAPATGMKAAQAAG